MVCTLRHPEYLTLTAPDGVPCRGACQEWFPGAWQRRAGCGPTTASVLLSYLASTRRALAGLAPDRPRTAAEFLPFMEEVWRYVTPGARGLDSPESFVLGCRSFAFSRGLHLTGESLSLPEWGQGKRPSLAWCRELLFTALSEDRPLAFLNFSGGEVAELDDWHWVPVVAAEEEGDRLWLLILDEGREKTVDFTLWWHTSRLGGALASLSPAEPPRPFTLRNRREKGGLLCCLTEGREKLTVRMSRIHPPEHWLVSWPCALLEAESFVLMDLTLPESRKGRDRCRALLVYAVQTAREEGGRALRLSLPAGEAELIALCRELGFRTARDRTGRADLCYLEKEL